MKNKRNNGLRMTCVLLMLLTLVFVGNAMAYADDDSTPAAEQEVIEAPQTDAEAEKAYAEAEEADVEAEEANAEAVQAAVHVDFIQLQLGSSNYSVSIPRSYRNGEVTIEEVQANQVAYYFSPDSAMDFDIYQFPRPHPELSFEEYMDKTAADFNGGSVRVRKINGIEVGTYKSREVYDGIEYDVMAALMEEGSECIEIVFWLDGDNAEQEATAILKTLSAVESYELQLGSSPFYLSVPVGYKAGELSEEDIEESAIGYYYSESSPLDFDVYQWDREGHTLEEYAIGEARLYEAERVEYRTVNDILLASYLSYEEYEGQMYSVANYLFENGSDLMKISFWLDGEVAVRQADRILSTLHRVEG
jgi:hypothetical protein